MAVSNIDFIRWTTAGKRTNSQTKKDLFDWLGKKLGIEKADDWYNMTYNDIVEHGVSDLIRSKFSLSQGLQLIYPGHQWDTQKFKYKPNRHIIRDYYTEQEINSRAPNRYWRSKDNLR